MNYAIQDLIKSYYSQKNVFAFNRVKCLLLAIDNFSFAKYNPCNYFVIVVLVLSVSCLSEVRLSQRVLVMSAPGAESQMPWGWSAEPQAISVLRPAVRGGARAD